MCVTCIICLQDIEADCSRLLATGLFGRARPAAIPAKRGEAPQFGAVIPEQEEDEHEEEQQEQGSSISNKVRGKACVTEESQSCVQLASLSFCEDGTRQEEWTRGKGFKLAWHHLPSTPPCPSSSRQQTHSKQTLLLLPHCCDLQAGVVSDGVYSGDVSLQMVPPLGSLKFIVVPRVLPLISSMEVRLDSSIKQMPGEEEGGARAAARWQQAQLNYARQGAPTHTEGQGGRAPCERHTWCACFMPGLESLCCCQAKALPLCGVFLDVC